MKLRRSKPEAFTLIELLVVVAVISVLAAILLPVLKTAGEMAQRAACQSNMRQIYVGGNVYATDYDGFLPGCGYGPYWPAITYNQGMIKQFARDYLRSYFGGYGGTKAADRGVLACPSSRSAEYPDWPGPTELIDYWINGFGPPGYGPSSPCAPHSKVYDYPRIDKVTKSEAYGPKAFCFDYNYLSPWTGDWRRNWYTHLNNHEPGNPIGMNVTAGDGTVRWVPRDYLGSCGTYTGALEGALDLAFPRGYYVIIWGSGTIFKDADGLCTYGKAVDLYEPGSDGWTASRKAWSGISYWKMYGFRGP